MRYSSLKSFMFLFSLALLLLGALAGASNSNRGFTIHIDSYDGEVNGAYYFDMDRYIPDNGSCSLEILGGTLYVVKYTYQTARNYIYKVLFTGQDVLFSIRLTQELLSFPSAQAISVWNFKLGGNNIKMLFSSGKSERARDISNKIICSRE